MPKPNSTIRVSAGGTKVLALDVQRELQWRRWFPERDRRILDARDVLPDEDVQILFDGFVSFCEENLVIRHPLEGRIPFRLRKAQSETVWDWIKYRRVINLKARQIGFSTLAAAFVLWVALGVGDRNIIVLSKGERESVKLLAKTKLAYKNMPEWVRERAPRLLDRTRQMMTFDNDSTIESLPSGNEPARGDTAFMVIIDEWAFLTDPENAWAGVEPTADLGGRIIGISTAKGEGTFFHKWWLQALDGGEFHPVFHPWSAVDERDDEWYEKKKRALLPWQLAQEYPSTWEEAFVGSGNPVFSPEVISRFGPLAPEVRGRVGVVRGEPMFWPDEGGEFEIWVYPEKDVMYSVGADVAGGLSDGDWSVAWVLRVSDGMPCARWRGRIDPDVFGAETLPAIGHLYNQGLIVPEVNNHGISTLKALQRARYPRLYRRRSFTKRKDAPTEQMGWLTTYTSKPLLVDGLNATLREDGFVLGDEVTINELRAFVRGDNGRMQGYPHDDCVMALAIADMGRKFCVEHRLIPKVGKAPYGSIAYWERELDRQAKSKLRSRGRLRPSFARG